MRVHLNLSIIASLVAASIGFQNVAYAKVKDVDVVGSEKSGVQVYVNTQQRSLYQIALLSGISVSELRQLNKGILDKTDIVKVGERIILPSSSPLFATEGGRSLPVLGGQIDPNAKGTDYQVASALKALGQQDWNNMSSDQLKDNAKTRLQSETESYIRNQVRTNVVNPVEAAAQNLLSKFGTAELKLSVSDEFSLRGSSLKLFSPWYDSSSTVIFSQMSIAEYDKRTIGNIGLGQRWDVNDKWLIGYNVFLDHDFSRAHNRLGVGLEAWTDYLRFAANYYYPLSDWKNSKDFDGFEERAARGFDIRAQAYLPSYPHVGASLMFEKYYGDEVALFGKDKLQKDPSAVTVGVDYTPVPMFTIRGEHKQGSNSNTEAKVDLSMNYRIGVPLKDQLDPDKVAAARSLKGSRYDFVDRNNNIILEYRDQRLMLNLAAFTGVLEEGSTHEVKVTKRARNAIKSVDFDATFDKTAYLIAPTASTARSDDPLYGWTLKIPPYVLADGSRAPVHKLAVIGIDDRGTKAKSNTIDIAVVMSQGRLPNIHKVQFKDNKTTALSGQLEYTDNTGKTSPFNDKASFEAYPTAVTAGNLAEIEKFWNVTRTDDKGGLVSVPLAIDKCKPNEHCAIVTGISKVKGVNGQPDQYNLELKYEFAGKSPEAVLRLPGYEDSKAVSIAPNMAGKAQMIVVYLDGVKYAASLGDTWETEPDVDNMIISSGKTVSVKAFEGTNESSAEIQNPNVKWSLIGDNKLACAGLVTDLGTTGNFEVSHAATYKIPSTNAESLAAKGESLNGIKASPQAACAGDQGFKLRVAVE